MHHFRHLLLQQCGRLLFPMARTGCVLTSPLAHARTHSHTRARRMQLRLSATIHDEGSIGCGVSHVILLKNSVICCFCENGNLLLTTCVEGVKRLLTVPSPVSCWETVAL
jgi:hypothetical protein